MKNTNGIKVLDVNTANQIAAGEVVEKPASVVKELVENALDAGATQIDVTVTAGGTEYIRVVDNGCGMNEEDARLSVLRHATSKIASAEDLLKLGSLGFRGEALPSIASVSKFTLLTRPEEEEFATSLKITGGEEIEVTSAGANAGTTVIVEDLFFNVPARRKFLKTIGTEGRYVSELLTKLALSRPDVCFTFVNNDKEVLHTPGSGELLTAVHALYGKDIASELLPVYFKDPRIEITGYVGKPTILKNSRQWQTIFVNGRSISNKMIAKAIDHAYQSQIPKSGFPFAVLDIRVEPSTVDVNVHPQKSEVKFSDEGNVYRAVFKALTDALTMPLKGEKLSATLLEDSPLREFVTVKTEPVGSNVEYQPVALDKSSREKQESIFKNEATFSRSAGVYKMPTEPVFRQSSEEDSYRTEIPVLTVSEAAEEIRKSDAMIFSGEDSAVKEQIAFTDANCGVAAVWPIGQVNKTFIIAQSEDSLYLIDQHAAHERIIYDKLVAAHENIPAQQLLLPLYIDLAEEEMELVEEHKDAFLSLGVEFAAAGENVLRVSSLPVDISADDAESFIREISKMLGELRNVSASDLRQEILHMTACKAAIKAGQLLNMRQMRQLIVDLLNTTHPFTCPHGRPCMIEIDSDKLYKMFKRTGF